MNNLTKHYCKKIHLESINFVLDVGPGFKSDGIDLKKINNSIIVDVIEGDDDVIQFQKKNKNINSIVKVDFANDEFQLNPNLKKYDIIFCYEVIEHIKNPSFFLEKLKFLLADDGMIFLTCPTKYSEQIMFRINSNYNKNTLYPHVNFFTKSSILNLCAFNDLKVVNYKVFNFSFFVLHFIFHFFRFNHNVSDGKVNSKLWKPLYFILIEIPRVFEKIINYKISSLIGRNHFFLIKKKSSNYFK